jgi:hypothetical protein
LAEYLENEDNASIAGLLLTSKPLDIWARNRPDIKNLIYSSLFIRIYRKEKILYPKIILEKEVNPWQTEMNCSLIKSSIHLNNQRNFLSACKKFWDIAQGYLKMESWQNYHFWISVHYRMWRRWSEWKLIKG